MDVANAIIVNVDCVRAIGHSPPSYAPWLRGLYQKESQRVLQCSSNHIGLIHPPCEAREPSCNVYRNTIDSVYLDCTCSKNALSSPFKNAIRDGLLSVLCSRDVHSDLTETSVQTVHLGSIGGCPDVTVLLAYPSFDLVGVG